ncbi:NAD(P)H-binding protein [Nostoc sp. ChiSLP03a]|uniref:NAD(P)H-binding protein n=1 Tax=Nostoc sp. ChiSLP03a TaxID=3075380 RepID=UPI002AD3879E|nr:NAD(P)H-binding protein [Nostoc sp. ChiSLP03a]MDZ8211164.1 NAD(P)H-binding protein [Nostoc sp. ChiSLP03a]
MKVIVTGSLGNISKPLAKELVQKGHTVTVISSKPEKQKDIEALGATAAIGSLEDVNFLVSTFTGADAVYAMVPPNYTVPDPREYYQKTGSNYAQAIQRSGVKRVVHLSSMGANLDKGTGFILGSHDVEGILNELSDVAITHLRPGYFYSNLYNFVDMIKGLGFIGANYGGDDKLVMVAPRDIAAAAAEEIETAVTDKQVRYVVSDEHTANETAYILGEAIGKPDLKWVILTDEQTQSGLEESGMSAHIAANFVEMGTSIHNGASRQDYELHKPIAMGKVKLEDFAKEFAAAF